MCGFQKKQHILDCLMFTDYINGLLTGFYLAIVFGALLIGWLYLVLQEQQQQQQQQQQQRSVPASVPVARRSLFDAREKKQSQPQNRSDAVLIP
jgi:cell division protein FtsI/penicillin-binding protein 2